MAFPLTAASRPETALPAHGWPRADPTPTTVAVRWRLMMSCWLLLAMVLAQTLGFVHGSAHVHLPQGGHLPTVTITPQSAGSVATALQQLFDDHDDPAQCRLYDQVSRGDCAPTADLAGAAAMRAASAPAETTVPWHCGDCLPSRARGPPLAG